MIYKTATIVGNIILEHTASAWKEFKDLFIYLIYMVAYEQ